MEETPGAESGYRLAARGRRTLEDDRLSLLEKLFDPASRRRRQFVEPGWRCLEVGAGRGSMAVWLAEKVGPSGQVVATDIDVTYLKRLDLPNLEVHRHNILEDPLEALGRGSFDLVSSRLMLFWLAGKQETAIRHMAELLRPGGWLVDEDGDWGTVGPVDPTHPLSVGYPAPTGMTSGGHPAATISPSGRNSRRFSSLAGCGISAMRPMPRWCAAAARGQAGGCKRLKGYAKTSELSVS
jgi:SAM-dependent methyltransferase